MRLIFPLLLLSACAHTPQGLPHRQEWELYRQANSPTASQCTEGTQPFYIVEDGHMFFLMCVNVRSQPSD